MAVLPVFCHQPMKEADVGKSLQKIILTLRLNIRNFQLPAGIL